MILVALIGLHLLSGTAALALGHRLGRRAWVVAAAAPVSTLAWAIAHFVVGDSSDVTASVDWVPAYGLTVDLRADSFSALMIALVSGIGSLVFAYGWHYFGTGRYTARAAGLLTLFAGSMLGVVVADNLLLLFTFWELTSVTSYLLIGLDDADPDARDAAQHALLVTGLGGLAMLAGFVVIGQEAGTYRLSEIVADAPTGTAVAVALVLVLVGAFTKSAQYPFHSWLPGAMVAPTPISAYLHSAAMVKAGIYLVARLAPAFAETGPWRPLVVVVVLVTMIAGGLRALRPFDLKQLLAFGTISQLGFLTVLLGVGQPEATAAGCALLLAHGVFKAALFMVVGIVDHEARTRDIRDLPELGDGWGPTRVAALVSAASMAAVPPLAGFIAKEEAYASFVDGSTADRLVLAGIVTGSVLTVAYSLRFAAAVAGTAPGARDADEVDGRPAAPHAPSAGFVLPALVLATASVLLGLVPGLWSWLVDAAANDLDPSAHAHLAQWHGINLPLVLSIATLALGIGVHALRERVAAVQGRIPLPPDGTRVFRRIVRATLRAATRTTAVLQSGSLPIYAGVVLTTAVAAPLAAMFGGEWWPGWPDLVGSPTEVPIALLLAGGAVAATAAQRRFTAALLLGVVGYGMALLFVTHGAPDLALTQFGVETLSMVVFLLVLRVLPDRFERRPAAVTSRVRVAVSVAVGVFVVLLATTSAGWRTAPPVSEAMSERALEEGYGRNVVNVILVDIRGFDTLGEVTVLATAAVGIVALARAGRAPRRPAPSWPATPDGAPR